MKIEVAGAGAGKTNSMAARVLDCVIPEGQMVFCVAFTNAAADNIASKVVASHGSLPDNIKVSTIHSFLYSELIKPYYHLLYNRRYEGISIIKLPDDNKFRNSRISELDRQGLIHQTVIPQRAKWVVDKKSGDKARIRALRAKVLALFETYCHKIFLDEAQDIDKDMKAILVALDNAGVDIELSGDPKQDVKGYGCFRELIDSYEDVQYAKKCYRCPAVHLRLSNTLANESEKQVADTDNRAGSITVHFESETNVNKLISDGDYGLVYISRKNERFETHADDKDDRRLVTLCHEIAIAIRAKSSMQLSDLEINRMAYHAAERILVFVDNGGTPKEAISRMINPDYINYDKTWYARMMNEISVPHSVDRTKIIVKSIEAVKGLEHEECLFVLTRDLAPYLVGEKIDDNKTKHLLYVALTRSLDDLSILVTSEVEEQYSRERILSILNG